VRRAQEQARRALLPAVEGADPGGGGGRDRARRIALRVGGVAVDIHALREAIEAEADRAGGGRERRHEPRREADRCGEHENDEGEPALVSAAPGLEEPLHRATERLNCGDIAGDDSPDALSA